MGKRTFVDNFPKLVYTGEKNYQYKKKKDDDKAIVCSAIVGKSKVV